MVEQSNGTRNRSKGASKDEIPQLHPNEASKKSDGCYRVPIINTVLPNRLVEAGLFGALIGTAVLGIVDAPVAALIGAGVIVIRHRKSSK